MAITGQITVNQSYVLEVDADPSVSGVIAPQGSIAMLQGAAGFWQKTGSGDTGWTQLLGGDASGVTAHEFFEDFLIRDFAGHNGEFDWNSVATGGGSGVTIDAGAPDNTSSGVITITPGTTTSGRASLESFNGNNRILAGGTQTIEWRVRVPTLSSAGQRYITRVGMMDSSAAGDPANGVYFKYSDNVNSGQWQGITRNASTSTTVSSSVAVTAAVWHKLRFQVNAAGTNVDFYIDDALIGSATTNIPTANPMRFMVTQEKTVGTTNIDLLADSLYYRTER